MMAENILGNPFLNKGTAFTLEEREALGIAGALPPRVQSIEEQAEQNFQQVKLRQHGPQQRKFVMEIFNTNRTLFYYMVQKHIDYFMPIIYDPIIAPAVEDYSHIFMQPQQACFLSIDDMDRTEEYLRNAANGRDIKLIVVTDSQAILGIGDWGVNGVNISVGKLMVYTAAAGVDPRKVLPVVLDVGTNNEKLLNDPLYLGNKHHRITGKRYDRMVDRFVRSARMLFPDVYIHFEDFGRDNATRILNFYKQRIPVFNDDVQGTGIVCLAGVLRALKISGQKITDQKFLTFGAGTAGMGIANKLCDELVMQGLSLEEARKHFYLVDKQGLLFDDTPDLTPEQKPFVRHHDEFPAGAKMPDLLSSVKAVHPTIMIGTSAVPGAFTEAVVKEMAAHTERPVIFPISNPTKLMEAHPDDLIKWTDGRALVATGVPMPAVDYKGVSYKIGQANNALIYPGVGLGVLAAKPWRLNKAMLSAAAHSLGHDKALSKPGTAVLPPVKEIRQFTVKVAEAVVQSAIDQGIADPSVTNAERAVMNTQWRPKYEREYSGITHNNAN
jgi:malate dehydrogenase (oxaloacetate-decarboxylating)